MRCLEVASSMMVTFRRKRRCFSRLAYLKKVPWARRIIKDPQSNPVGPACSSFSVSPLPVLPLVSIAFLACQPISVFAFIRHDFNAFIESPLHDRRKLTGDWCVTTRIEPQNKYGFAGHSRIVRIVHELLDDTLLLRCTKENGSFDTARSIPVGS